MQAMLEWRGTAMRRWRGMLLGGGCLAVAAAQPAMAQVTVSTVFDFATNTALKGGTAYAGPALSPSGDELWWANPGSYAAISLTGTVRFSGTFPAANAGAVTFGSLSFDPDGNAWGIARNQNYTGTIFKITSAGALSSVATLKPNLGYPATGVAYYNGSLYGSAFAVGSPKQHLFGFDTTTKVQTKLMSVSDTDYFGAGKPVVDGSGNIYTTTGKTKYTGSVYDGEFTSWKHNIGTAVNTFSAFQAYNAMADQNVFGGAYTPALDSAGNVYTLALILGNPVGVDRLIETAATGKSTVLASFASQANSYNYFAGLVYDAVHGRVYGAYSSETSANLGTVFCYNPAAKKFATIFTFNGTNGSNPVGDLSMSADGTKLFGATNYGGSLYDGTDWDSGYGILFQLSLGATPPC
jgi:hypothetical protein